MTKQSFAKDMRKGAVKWCLIQMASINVSNHRPVINVAGTDPHVPSSVTETSLARHHLA